MILLATSADSTIEVVQDGGFGPDSRSILRTVSQGWKCSGGRNWSFPRTGGALLGLKVASDLLRADLKLDQVLKDWMEKLESQTAHEERLRRSIQGYMDGGQPLANYTTVSSPLPWRHQQIAYHWAIRTEALYVAHKPGLGKTRTGADVIRGRIETGVVGSPSQIYLPPRESEVKKGAILEERNGMTGGVLIVCPKVVIGTWRDELWRWQGIPSMPILGTRPAKLNKAGKLAWVHLCTYDSLDVLEGNRYDGIIADEAHFLANEDTWRWARMVHLRKTAKWALALSGTPLSNQLQSLWAQYYWLDGGRTLGSSYQEYRNRYFGGKNRKLQAVEGAEEKVAARISRITYFLTMQEAFPGKPRKIQQISRVEMTRDQVYYYNKICNEVIADIHAGTVTAPEIQQKLIKLLQVCQGYVRDDAGKEVEFNGNKIKELRDMLVGGDLSDRKVIVWCRFKRDLRQVSKMLTRSRVQHMVLHGDLNDKERDVVKEVWNIDPRYRVLVGMLQMGIGINLHAPNCVVHRGGVAVPYRCSTSVFLGVDWRVTQLEQAMDRVYRGDQVETCLYRYLLCEDTEGLASISGQDQPIDFRVYSVLLEKLEQGTRISEESIDYIRRLL